jgi:RNA polymerase sigma factor (sigma-70 family)
MDEHDWLAARFDEHRAHLRAVAYRRLGEPSEADDAVQESWLRLSRSDISGVAKLGGWLTTVVARVCLDLLRARKARREEPLGAHVPEPIVSRVDRTDPEQEALLADSVGLALLVVLETLSLAERLAFVLHDIFAVPFDEIAAIVDRSPSAARQLAGRGRRRVQGATTSPDADLTCRREVVDAFLVAARDGDFGALLAVLDPDVVLRADLDATPSGASREVRDALAVAEGTLTFSGRARFARPALVKGAAGVVVAADRRPIAVMGFTVARKDRRDRHTRRPRASPRTHPDGPRRLTFSSSATSLNAARSILVIASPMPSDRHRSRLDGPNSNTSGSRASKATRFLADVPNQSIWTPRAREAHRPDTDRRTLSLCV